MGVSNSKKTSEMIAKPAEIYKKEVKHLAVMQALDSIQKRFGSHQMKLANQDLQRTWKMKQEHLSPRYTTLLKEVITVKTS